AAGALVSRRGGVRGLQSAHPRRRGEPRAHDARRGRPLRTRAAARRRTIFVPGAHPRPGDHHDNLLVTMRHALLLMMLVGPARAEGPDARLEWLVVAKARIARPALLGAFDARWRQEHDLVRLYGWRG